MFSFQQFFGKHLLMILLTIALAGAISIAAVPQLRGPVTDYIGENFGPKADTNSMIIVSVSPNVVYPGDITTNIITVTVDNQFHVEDRYDLGYPFGISDINRCAVKSLRIGGLPTSSPENTRSGMEPNDYPKPKKINDNFWQYICPSDTVWCGSAGLPIWYTQDQFYGAKVNEGLLTGIYSAKSSPINQCQCDSGDKCNKSEGYCTRTVSASVDTFGSNCKAFTDSTLRGSTGGKATYKVMMYLLKLNPEKTSANTGADVVKVNIESKYIKNDSLIIYADGGSLSLSPDKDFTQYLSESNALKPGNNTFFYVKNNKSGKVIITAKANDSLVNISRSAQTSVDFNQLVITPTLKPVSYIRPDKDGYDTEPILLINSENEQLSGILENTKFKPGDKITFESSFEKIEADYDDVTIELPLPLGSENLPKLGFVEPANNKNYFSFDKVNNKLIWHYVGENKLLKDQIIKEQFQLTVNELQEPVDENTLLVSLQSRVVDSNEQDQSKWQKSNQIDLNLIDLDAPDLLACNKESEISKTNNDSKKLSWFEKLLDKNTQSVQAEDNQESGEYCEPINKSDEDTKLKKLNNQLKLQLSNGNKKGIEANLKNKINKGEDVSKSTVGVKFIPDPKKAQDNGTNSQPTNVFTSLLTNVAISALGTAAQNNQADVDRSKLNSINSINKNSISDPKLNLTAVSPNDKQVRLDRMRYDRSSKTAYIGIKREFFTKKGDVISFGIGVTIAEGGPLNGTNGMLNISFRPKSSNAEAPKPGYGVINPIIEGVEYVGENNEFDMVTYIDDELVEADPIHVVVEFVQELTLSHDFIVNSADQLVDYDQIGDIPDVAQRNSTNNINKMFRTSIAMAQDDNNSSSKQIQLTDSAGNDSYELGNFDNAVLAILVQNKTGEDQVNKCVKITLPNSLYFTKEDIEPRSGTKTKNDQYQIGDIELDKSDPNNQIVYYNMSSIKNGAEFVISINNISKVISTSDFTDSTTALKTNSKQNNVFDSVTDLMKINNAIAADDKQVTAELFKAKLETIKQEVDNNFNDYSKDKIQAFVDDLKKSNTVSFRWPNQLTYNNLNMEYSQSNGGLFSLINDLFTVKTVNAQNDTDKKAVIDIIRQINNVFQQAIDSPSSDINSQKSLLWSQADLLNKKLMQLYGLDYQPSILLNNYLTSKETIDINNAIATNSVCQNLLDKYNENFSYIGLSTYNISLNLNNNNVACQPDDSLAIPSYLDVWLHKFVNGVETDKKLQQKPIPSNIYANDFSIAAQQNTTFNFSFKFKAREKTVERKVENNVEKEVIKYKYFTKDLLTNPKLLSDSTNQTYAIKPSLAYINPAKKQELKDQINNRAEEAMVATTKKQFEKIQTDANQITLDTEKKLLNYQNGLSAFDKFKQDLISYINKEIEKLDESKDTNIFTPDGTIKQSHIQDFNKELNLIVKNDSNDIYNIFAEYRDKYLSTVKFGGTEVLSLPQVKGYNKSVDKIKTYIEPISVLVKDEYDKNTYIFGGKVFDIYNNNITTIKQLGELSKPGEISYLLEDVEDTKTNNPTSKNNDFVDVAYAADDISSNNSLISFKVVNKANVELLPIQSDPVINTEENKANIIIPVKIDNKNGIKLSYTLQIDDKIETIITQGNGIEYLHRTVEFTSNQINQTVKVILIYQAPAGTYTGKASLNVTVNTNKQEITLYNPVVIPISINGKNIDFTKDYELYPGDIIDVAVEIPGDLEKINNVKLSFGLSNEIVESINPNINQTIDIDADNTDIDGDINGFYKIYSLKLNKGIDLKYKTIDITPTISAKSNIDGNPDVTSKGEELKLDLWGMIEGNISYYQNIDRENMGVLPLGNFRICLKDPSHGGYVDIESIKKKGSCSNQTDNEGNYQLKYKRINTYGEKYVLTSLMYVLRPDYINSNIPVGKFLIETNSDWFQLIPDEYPKSMSKIVEVKISPARQEPEWSTPTKTEEKESSLLQAYVLPNLLKAMQVTQDVYPDIKYQLLSVKLEKQATGAYRAYQSGTNMVLWMKDMSGNKNFNLYFPNSIQNTIFHEFTHYLENITSNNVDRTGFLCNHCGLGNGSSGDSRSEGYSETNRITIPNYINANDLSNWVSGNINGITRSYVEGNRNPTYDLIPIFGYQYLGQPVSDLVKINSESSVREDTVIGLLINMLTNAKIEKGLYVKPNEVPWFEKDLFSPDTKIELIGPETIEQLKANNTTITDIILSGEAKNVSSLYESLLDKKPWNKIVGEIQFPQKNSTISATAEISYLNFIFALYGIFTDQDGDWRWDAYEHLGTSGNSQPFKAMVQGNTSCLFNVEKLIGARPVRNFPPLTPNGFIKLNNDTGASQNYHINVITNPIVKIYKENDEVLNQDYTMDTTVNNKGLLDLNIPYGAMVYINTDKSDNYAVISYQEYWDAVTAANKGIGVGYIGEYNFKVQEGVGSPTLEQMQADYAAQQAQIAKDRQAVEAQAKIAELEKQLVQAKADKEKAEANRLQAQRDMEAANKAKAEAEAKAQAEEQARLDAEAQLALAQAKIIEQEKEITRLKAVIADLESQLAQLRVEAETAKKDYQDKIDSLVKSQNEKLTSIQNEYNTAKDKLLVDYSTLLDQKQQLIDTQEELQKSQAKKDKKITDLTKELNDKDTRIKELTTKFDDATTKVTQNEVNIQVLQSQLDEQTASGQTLQATITNLKLQLARALNIIDVYQKNSLERQLANEDYQSKYLETQLALIKSQDQVKEITDKYLANQKIIKDLTEEIQKLESTVADLNDQIISYQSKIEKLNTKLSDSYQREADLTNENTDLKAKLASSTSIWDKLKLEYDLAINSYQLKLTQANQDNITKDVELAQAKLDKAKLELANQTLQAELKQKEQELLLVEQKNTQDELNSQTTTQEDLNNTNLFLLEEEISNEDNELANTEDQINNQETNLTNSADDSRDDIIQAPTIILSTQLEDSTNQLIKSTKELSQETLAKVEVTSSTNKDNLPIINTKTINNEVPRINTQEDELIIDAKNFSLAKEVTIQIDDKDIATTPIISPDLTLKVPNEKLTDLSLGNHTVTIEDDLGNKASTTFKVTQNEILNYVNFKIAVMTLLIVLFGLTTVKLVFGKMVLG